MSPVFAASLWYATAVEMVRARPATAVSTVYSRQKPSRRNASTRDCYALLGRTWYACSMDKPARKAYPSDVSDDAWALVSPELVLLNEAAPQRRYALREVLNGLRYMVRTGAPWRWLPHEFPPWQVGYQQPQRWLRAGVLEMIVPDRRIVSRVASGRTRHPSAASFDARTVQSTAASGERAGYDGHKRRQGSNPHLAVDTLGLLLAVHVTPAQQPERAQVAPLAEQVQTVPGSTVTGAFGDQGYTGAQAEPDAAMHGMRLEVVKLPQAHRGCVVLPRRWVVERSCAWIAKFRRLARDDERLPATVAARHFVACACLLLHRGVPLLTQSTEHFLGKFTKLRWYQSRMFHSSASWRATATGKSQIALKKGIRRSS